MKSLHLIYATALLPPSLLVAEESATRKVIYGNDFEAAEIGRAPADFMVMSGTFAVKEEGGSKFLELPGSPLDAYGLLFGPTQPDGVSASGRFFATRQGRKFPVFGISLNGVGGYRLQVSPGKKALEFYKGDEAKNSVPFEWMSGTWTKLRIQMRRTAGGVLVVEGKAWAADAAEPAAWLISVEEKEGVPPGRAGVWGSPYSGTPLRFDDLVLSPATDQ